MAAEESRPLRLYLGRDAIERALQEVAKLAQRDGCRYAVAGGVAMQVYGSPRLTRDLDCVSDRPLSLPELGRLSFGGRRYWLPDGTPLGWILRDDDYGPLYREALDAGVRDVDGVPVLAPEYLAAMKLAARRGKDQDDLLVLIRGEALDLEMARDLVYRLVGGRFARDELDAVVMEARWRDQLEEEG